MPTNKVVKEPSGLTIVLLALALLALIAVVIYGHKHGWFEQKDLPNVPATASAQECWLVVTEIHEDLGTVSLMRFCLEDGQRFTTGAQVAKVDRGTLKIGDAVVLERRPVSGSPQVSEFFAISSQPIFRGPDGGKHP